MGPIRVPRVGCQADCPHTIDGVALRPVPGPYCTSSWKESRRGEMAPRARNPTHRRCATMERVSSWCDDLFQMPVPVPGEDHSKVQWSNHLTQGAASATSNALASAHRQRSPVSDFDVHPELVPISSPAEVHVSVPHDSASATCPWQVHGRSPSESGPVGQARSSVNPSQLVITSSIHQVRIRGSRVQPRHSIRRRRAPRSPRRGPARSRGASACGSP